MATTVIKNYESLIRTFYTDLYTDVQRLVRYWVYWQFYDGVHYKQNNDELLRYNFCQRFVDKSLAFMYGSKGFTINTLPIPNSDYKEEQKRVANIEHVLNQIWRQNSMGLFCWEFGQTGAVTGDAWVFLEYDEDEKIIRLKVLDSETVFPTFVDGDYTKGLESVVVKTVLEDNAKNNGYLTRYRIDVKEYTKDTVYNYQKTDSIDRENPKAEPNILGFIPIIHVKNLPYAKSYYGRSDLQEIWTMNKAFNNLAQTFSEILDYYGSPITVITGASAKNLKKGVGKIWSGLPEKANVFNLSLGNEVESHLQYMKMLKEWIHEQGQIPEAALGKMQPISNTSAAALQIQYQPLIELTNAKKATYGPAFVQINEMIFRILKIMDPKRVEKVPDNPYERETEVAFPYGLPKDRADEVSQISEEMKMGIASRREAMERLGKSNIDVILTEVSDDRALLEEHERNKKGLSLRLEETDQE